MNSFQNTESDFPLNSYIDKTYIFNHKNVNKENLIQKSVKKTFNKVFNTNYKDSNEKLSEYINAESKQTISTIYEMGYENKLKYLEFPNSEIKLNYYLMRSKHHIYSLFAEIIENLQIDSVAL